MKRIIACTIALALSTTTLCAQDIPLSRILVEKEGWREVAKDWPLVCFLKARPTGDTTIFQDVLRQGKQWTGRIDADGQAKRLPPTETPGYVNAAMVEGPAGWYGFSFDGQSNTVNLTRKNKEVSWFKIPVSFPICMTIWPDGGHLVIGQTFGGHLGGDQTWGTHLWTFRIEKDGSLGPGDRYYSLQTKPGVKMHVAAMTMDAGYLLYACTPLGIQVFDPTGRLSGVIAAPSKEPMTAITIGGEKADTLFIAAGDKIFARKIQGKAPYTLKKAK